MTSCTRADRSTVVSLELLMLFRLVEVGVKDGLVRKLILGKVSDRYGRPLRDSLGKVQKMIDCIQEHVAAR